MPREGRSYYEREDRYEHDYDNPDRGQKWRDQDIDLETRDRLERYFSRHADEGVSYREEASRHPEASRQKMRGGSPYRPGYDLEREDFEQAKREPWEREEPGRERRYAADIEWRRGYLPEAARDEWRVRGPFTGRGPKGYKRPDERIREDVCDRLMLDGGIDAGNIEVEVRDAVVILRGSVDDRRTKYAAEDVSESVFGVRDVQNELRIESPSSTFTPRQYRPGGRPEMIARISRLMEVFDKDMASIGQVREIRDNGFILDRRTGPDILVSFMAVDRVDNRIVLNVVENQIDRMGWQTFGKE